MTSPLPGPSVVIRRFKPAFLQSIRPLPAGCNAVGGQRTKRFSR